MNCQYDVAIVGAGIGGLVSGCYLAKAGLKVLMLEQHSIPGGYCTSFQRKGYKFDVGVHYLGSLREGGALHRIFSDLSLLGHLSFVKSEYCDRILTPDKTIFIKTNPRHTIEEFISNFPDEKKAISSFFKFILDNDYFSLACKLKGKTFKEVLDHFFRDYKIKAVLSIPLGNLGLSSLRISALAAVILYKEYILDPGYYPKGGIQKFPDMLASQFQGWGGEIRYSTKVSRICVRDQKVNGITLDSGEFIEVGTVVSNADASLTFTRLLEYPTSELKVVEQLTPSISAIVMYLGVNDDLKEFNPSHYATWYFSSYDIDACYERAFEFENIVKGDLDYILCSTSSIVDHELAPSKKNNLKLFLGVRNFDFKMWDKVKDLVEMKMLLKVSELIPNLSSRIEVKEIATPLTFNKFTLNRDGALFGWRSDLKHMDRKMFPEITSVQGLYLVGHWTISGVGQGGVTQAAISGRNTAKTLLRANLR